MTFASLRSVGVALLATTVGVAPAAAQRAAGPFSGILGSVADSDARHTLEVRGSLFGAWDDNLTDPTDPALDNRFLRSGGAAGASGSLIHARRSQRFQWQSSVSSSLRLYGTDSSDRAATYSARTGINTDLGQRVSVSASGAVTYSPYYDFAPGMDGRLSNAGAFGGGFNVATAAERNRMTSLGSGVSFRLSRRDSIGVSGSASRHEFLDQPDTGIDSWTVGASWSRSLFRNFGVHAGFTRQEVSYDRAGNSGFSGDNIDIGVDYHDSLKFSLSRQTALTFGTSTAVLRWNNQTQFRLNGTAALTRSFARSGSASLRYVRSTDFDAAFRDPVLTDMVSAGISNQLGRRTTWSAQIAYQRGSIGLGSSTPTFNSYNAGGGVQLAMTRHVGIYTDYSFYRYEVPSGSTVFTSLSRFSRQSVTAGLSLWAPLIADKRSSRDSR